MKDKKAGKARTIVNDKVIKRRRGRPKLTDAEKAAEALKVREVTIIQALYSG